MNSSDSKSDLDPEAGGDDRDALLNRQPSMGNDFGYGTWQEPAVVVEKKNTYCVNSSLGIGCIAVATVSLTLLIVAIIFI